MADADPWSRLHDVAADQFGLFTYVQAEKYGISRDELERLAQLEVLYIGDIGAYGFMKDAADMLSYVDWAATWLMLDPYTDIAARRSCPDFIISHATAASIRELGTIVSYGLYLTGPGELTIPPSKRIFFYQQSIGIRGVDWDLVDGLPVATPRRIIADLAADFIDGSHLGTVIADVVEEGLLPLSEVVALLEPYARHWSASSGTELAEIFAASANRVLQEPA